MCHVILGVEPVEKLDLAGFRIDDLHIVIWIRTKIGHFKIPSLCMVNCASRDAHVS
jgi:hypothetical protein